MGRPSVRTADYSDHARKDLGDAVAAARRTAGHRWRSTFIKEHPNVKARSLAKVERGEPGVGIGVLEEIGKALAIHHPGKWTRDTPREILDGAAPPNLEEQSLKSDPDSPSGPIGDIDQVGDLLLDPDAIGTDEWLEKITEVLDPKDIPEVMRLGLEARRKRREIEQVQQRIAERVRPELPL